MLLDHLNHLLADLNLMQNWWIIILAKPGLPTSKTKLRLPIWSSSIFEGQEVKYLCCNNALEHGTKLTIICKERGMSSYLHTSKYESDTTSIKLKINRRAGAGFL